MKWQFSAGQKHIAWMMSAALAMNGALLTGCEASSKAPETPEEFHAAMVDRSVVQLGNTCRLNAIMDRAEQGEDITIGYIGGSITEGYSAGAQSPDCYASLSAAAFQTTYLKGGTVTCQNNGLSGTPSVLGNLRASTELLATDPDIILIEFAVNDGGDYQYIVAYESLVRACLAQENQPAVILLFTYMENGHTCQENQQKIGEYYDLGMISVRDALVPELESGRMTWDTYSDDDVHPNIAGHALLAEYIARYFEKASAKKAETSYTIPAETLEPKLYENAALLDASNLKFKDGAWAVRTTNSHFPAGFTYQRDMENAPLAFTVKTKELFIVYQKASSTDYGMLGVYVNGKLEGIVNGFGSNAWGGPAVDLVYESDTVQELQVELKMLEDHTEKQFEILAIGVTGS